MAELRDDVVLDFQQAIREINRVERLFENAFGDPIDVDLDIDQGVVDAVRRLDAGLQDVETSVRQVNAQLSSTEGIADAATVDVRQLATALGVSEDEARELVRQFTEARATARQLEDATRAVANQLGLAETDARQLASSMRSAASASDDVDRHSQAGSKSINTMGIGVGKLVAGIGSALILVQSLRVAARFVAGTFEAASDAAETLTKTEVVFGSFADDLVKFSSDAPAALGLANREALAFASTFGNLFVSMGLAREESALMSREIVTLGADLASFNNIDVDEALIKLRAGLVGEFEALRTVGVALNATIVEQKAYELGLANINGEISEAAKIQARYALIVEQTTLAQGDFARTADGVANRQRTVNALFENFRQAAGEAFLPVLETILSMAPDLIDGLERLIPTLASMAQSFADSAAEGGGWVDTGLDILRVLPQIGGQFSALLSSNPFFTLTEGLVGFVAGGADVTKFGEEFKESVEQITDVADQINVNKTMQSFVEDLRAGVDPAEALANHLAELTRLGLDTADVTKFAEQFARIAGIDAGGIEAVVSTIKAGADAAGLQADQVQALIIGLRELNLVPAAPERPGARGGPQIDRAEISAATAAIQQEMAALVQVRVLAEEAGVGISEFALANQDAVDTILAGADPIARTTLEMALLADQAGILADTLHDRLGEAADFPLFDSLPEQIGVVTGQVEDESGKLIDVLSSSAEDVLAQIQAQNAATASFEADLVRLASAGAGALASRLAQEGPAAAAAAADFVENLDLALEAEEELTGTGENNANAYGDAIDLTLRGLDFTDPALAAVLALAADLTNPTALAAIDQAATIAAARYQATFGGGVAGAFNPAIVDGSDARWAAAVKSVPGGEVNLFLDNFRAYDPSGAAERAAAAAAAVAGSVNGPRR